MTFHVSRCEIPSEAKEEEEEEENAYGKNQQTARFW
jgi:hypothetical protein